MSSTTGSAGKSSGGSGSSATSSTPTTSKPPSPVMGTVEETYAGSGYYHVCFGGIPKPDWSGIESKSKETISDLCYRSLNPLKGQKSIESRTQGLTKKLALERNLKEFQEKVWDHLVKYGLDTFAY